MISLVNKDCFDYGGKAVKCCGCEGCSYYKTHEQKDAENVQSVMRLKRLGVWDYYKDKYKLSDVTKQKHSQGEFAR